MTSLRLPFAAAVLAACIPATSGFAPSSGPLWEIERWTVDGGGAGEGNASQAKGYELSGTIGQPDAGTMTSSGWEIQGGFWPQDPGGIPRAAPTCYADCNKSGTLTAEDLTCFQRALAAGQRYADCDKSGTYSAAADLACFQRAYAAGCP